MKRFLKIIGIVIVINAILFALAWIWISGIKEDQKQTKKKMKIIQNAYVDFNKTIDEFSDMRNNLYEQREDLYYETLADSADYWNKFIDNYAKEVEKLEKNSKDLKKNCKIKYGDVNTRSKCTNFVANYEAAHNYYISDIKMYNNLVDDYKKWNEDNKYPSLNKGTFPIYEKYIDFDEDGEYFGKEEVEKNAQ